MSLEPCPCGCTPSMLLLSSYKKDFVFFTGDCCEQWHVQIDRSKNGALQTIGDAIREWNKLPRAKGEE